MPLPFNVGAQFFACPWKITREVSEKAAFKRNRILVICRLIAGVQFASEASMKRRMRFAADVIDALPVSEIAGNKWPACWRSRL